MDLKSGYPFWAVKNGLMSVFPRLESNTSCDVLIVGAGITGALIARSLSKKGFDVVIAEERDVAWGSTAASTALLQYEIDTPMVDLAKKYGEETAALVYRACADAIPMLGKIARELRDVDFATKQSLYIASSRFHVARMREEFELRRKHRLPVDWLSKAETTERFGIHAPCALLTNRAAQVDPYRLTSRLLDRLKKNGVRIFDRTRIEWVQSRTRGVIARTETGVVIRAKHVVFAAGYSSQKWLRAKVASNRSSYAFVTDPIGARKLGTWSKTLLWESARPYIYSRSTADGRLLIGGEDDQIDIPARRDARVEKKVGILLKRARKLFPNLDLEPTFAWGGTFAETPDGLPYFGPHPEWGSRVLFAMGYGGNGITYSALGAEIIAATLKGEVHALSKPFAFSRIK
jgi:glycine/D-amino acid oxidase-like deaminating enzyme